MLEVLPVMKTCSASTGHLHGTFLEACRARQLLQDDLEWIRCLEDAERENVSWSAIRSLFVTIVAFNGPENPLNLYERFRHAMLRRTVSKDDPEEIEDLLADLYRRFASVGIAQQTIASYGIPVLLVAVASRDAIEQASPGTSR